MQNTFALYKTTSKTLFELPTTLRNKTIRRSLMGFTVSFACVFKAKQNSTLVSSYRLINQGNGNQAQDAPVLREWNDKKDGLLLHGLLEQQISWCVGLSSCS